MKKLIALVFAVALVAPVFAGDQKLEIAYGSPAVAGTALIATGNAVSKIIIASTGTAANVMYFRVGTSTKCAVSAPASAGTVEISFPEPVYMGSSLTLDCDSTDATVFVTVVYEKRPAR